MTPMIDLERASEFMRTHARLLDRRRFELLFADGSAEGAFRALLAYRNSDGGFGYGLEPDLRSERPVGFGSCPAPESGHPHAEKPHWPLGREARSCDQCT